MTDRVLLLSEDGAEPLRGFLRKLIAAPAAALATHRLILPAHAGIITPEDAAARLQHHLDGVKAAMQDLFPAAAVSTIGNCLNGNHAYFRELHAQGENEYACVGCHAGLR